MSFNKELNKWSCIDRHNLKTRTVNAKSLIGIKKEELLLAIKKKNYRMVNLEFPITLGLFRKIRKLGECQIFYCILDKFRLQAYELKTTTKNSSIINMDKWHKCLGYRGEDTAQ